MTKLLLAAMLLVAAPLPQFGSSEPENVVRHAIDAVEGDSVDVAERLWTRALQDDPADREAALGLATLAHYTYRDSTAERLYRSAMAGSAPDEITGYAAAGLARLGLLRARWAFADSLSTIAIAAARAARDSTLLARSLVIQAQARLPAAGPASALATLAEAAEVVPAHDLSTRATARCMIAKARALQGDARGAVDEALAGTGLAERAGDARALGDCVFTAAREYGRLFVHDSALASYDRAIAAFRRARDRADLADALYHRADFHRIGGRIGLAWRDAEQSLREGRASGRLLTAAWASTTLAQISIGLGDTRSAATHAAEATGLFASQDDSYGPVTARALEANIALAERDIAATRAAFESVREQAERVGWREMLPSAWGGLAWVALLDDDSARARVAVDTADALLNSLGMGAHGASMSFLEARIALRWGRLPDAERLFRTRIAAGDARGARRNYVDAARLAEVLMLQGRLDEAEREIHEAAERLDAWRGSISDRELRLLAFQASTDRADPDLGTASVIAALAADGRIASAFELVERGRARDLSDRLNRAAAFDSSGERVVRGDGPIPLDSLQRSLPDDSTAVFEYVTGFGDPTTLFVITRRSAHAHVLSSRDSLELPIARFAALLESGEDPRPLAGQLAASLLEPALSELDPAVKRLIVVPAGPLHRLPFDALVLPDGRFVVERFAIAIAPAATVAVSLRARAATQPPAGLAVLADPQFTNESRNAGDAEVFRSAVAGNDGLPRLEASGREASAVARYSDHATVLRRGDASEAWLKSATLTDFGVLHFATHALIDGSSITNTALALAATHGEDGFVRPGELSKLILAAELVVLSACRTAGGPIVRGEGVQGLAAPILAAGARAVAATWWPIGDAATIRLVDEFYAAMAAGQPVADALRTAKLAALERGAPVSEWAAFTIVGDPFARPLLRTPADRRGTWIYFAPALVLLLVGYGVVMRERLASRTRALPGQATRTHPS